METKLSEGQALIRDSLREFLAGELNLNRVRDLERSSEWDATLWGKLAQLGWLGLPFPEEAGGGGGTLTDVAIVVEELARHAAIVPYAEAMAAGLTLRAKASQGVAGEVASEISRGASPIVPAVLDATDSFATLAGDEAAVGRISGTRAFVEFGQFARQYLVRVRRDGEYRLELVTASQATTAARPLTTTGRTPSAMIDFRDAASVAATGPDGYDHLLLLGRALTAVQCLGYMQRAFEMATEYVKNRVQFGRPIGSFQAVQHHVANMAILLEATRFMVYEAIWCLEQDRSSAEQVATAKAWASKAAIEVTALAHQLHGGIGVTEEYDLHFFTLRAKERAVAWGTPAECMDVVARSIRQRTDWTTGLFVPTA